MTPPPGDRPSSGSPIRRPAVVEHVDSPRSTSDGRAATPWRLETLLETLLETVARLAARPIVHQVATFAVIGVVSTGAWAALYLLLRSVLQPTVANAIALVVTAVANTTANRRLTFGVSGRDGLVRDQGAGLVAFALALALTSGTAVALPFIAPHASRLVELAVLTIANAVATVVRFAVLRASIGRRAAAAG